MTFHAPIPPGRTAAPMIPAPIPTDDERRLQALRDMLILDTPPEERFDRVVRFAADEFDMPIVLVSLVDAKPPVVQGARGPGRLRDRPPVVVLRTRDRAAADPDRGGRAGRTSASTTTRWCIGAPNIRFYAGAPLQLPVRRDRRHAVHDRPPAAHARRDGPGHPRVAARPGRQRDSPRTRGGFE